MHTQLECRVFASKTGGGLSLIIIFVLNYRYHNIPGKCSLPGKRQCTKFQGVNVAASIPIQAEKLPGRLQHYHSPVLIFAHLNSTNDHLRITHSEIYKSLYYISAKSHRTLKCQPIHPNKHYPRNLATWCWVDNDITYYYMHYTYYMYT